MKDYIDENDISWDSYEDYITIEICGLCGCGDEEVKEDIIKILKLYKNKQFIDQPEDMDDKYYELILHILNNKGLLEHGTSVFGSWPTEKGKIIANRLCRGE